MNYSMLVSQLKDAAISYTLALNETKNDSSDEARELVSKRHAYLIESAIKFGGYVQNSTPEESW